MTLQTPWKTFCESLPAYCAASGGVSNLFLESCDVILDERGRKTRTQRSDLAKAESNMVEEEEKKEDGTGTKGKEADDGKETKTTASKKKLMSKSVVASKMSLKKINDGTGLSETSVSTGSSMTMKRQSDFDRLSKAPKYQNTYRLNPKKPFKPNEVYKLLESIVEREVFDFPQYDSFLAPKIIQSIAAEVRSSVKALYYDRYKICVLVYLGEKKLQGFHAAFRALWDQERDGWTTYYYQCRTYFLSCTCYGLYHD